MAFSISLDDLLRLRLDGHYRCMASRMEDGTETGTPCTRPIKKGLANVVKKISSGLSPDIHDPGVRRQYAKIANWLICGTPGHRSQVDRAVAFWKSELENERAPQWVAKWSKKDCNSDSKVMEQRSCKAVGHSGTDAARGRPVEEILGELSVHCSDPSTSSLLEELGEQIDTLRRAPPRRSRHPTTAKGEPDTASGNGYGKDALKQEPEDGTQHLTSEETAATVIKEEKPDSDVGSHSIPPLNLQVQSRSRKESSKEDSKARSDNTSTDLSLSQSPPVEPQGVPEKVGPTTRSKQAVGQERPCGLATFRDFHRCCPEQQDIDERITTKVRESLGPGALKDGRVYAYMRSDLPGMVKIGTTTRSIRARLKEHARCGCTPLLIHDPRQRIVPNALRVEGLVREELAKWRKHEGRCGGCERAHNEWFEIEPQVALESIERWRKWIEQKPYDETSGMLKSPETTGLKGSHHHGSKSVATVKRKQTHVKGGPSTRPMST